MFQNDIVYMDNSFVVSLDITVMISILQEINEVLHEKVLKAKYFYCFHNYVSEKINQ